MPETKGRTNSEEEPKSGENEEEPTSEEYRNFENFAKAILSIPPEEAKQINLKIPYPKKSN